MKTRVRSALTKTSVLWVFLVSLAATVCYFRELRPASALTKSHTTVRGRILQKQAHQNVEYRFDVADRSLINVGTMWDAGEYSAKQTGDDVTVYYVPSNPSVSSLNPPERELSWAKRDMLYFSILLPIVALPVLFLGAYRMSPPTT